MTVNNEGSQRGIGLAGGRWDQPDDGLQDSLDPDTVFGRDEDGFVGGQGENFLNFILHTVRIGGRQVDLVDHRYDVQVLTHSHYVVGHRLSFHSLGGIHDQQSAFAGGERARDFVGEIDVPGRVQEVELIRFAVLGGVVERHGVAFYRDSTLALQVHGIQDLVRHLSFGKRAGEFQDPVGQGGFTVIYVGYYAEISDVTLLHG